EVPLRGSRRGAEGLDPCRTCRLPAVGDGEMGPGDPRRADQARELSAEVSSTCRRHLVRFGIIGTLAVSKGWKNHHFHRLGRVDRAVRPHYKPPARWPLLRAFRSTPR